MTYRQTGRNISESTTLVPLSASQTFTGGWRDVSMHDTVSFAIKADTTCTIYADFTSDPTFQNIDSTLTYASSANIAEVHRLTITRQFFRLRVVETSGVDQTYLSVSTMAGTHPQLSAPMNLGLGLDSDAIAVRPTKVQDEIVIGRRPGVTSFTKFGHTGSLTGAAGEEIVWAATGNTFTPMTTADTFNIAYNSTTDGDSTTGALTLFVQYIDANGIDAVANVTLGSTGTDTTSFTGLGINRVAVSSSGSNDINANDITFTTTSGGDIQAIIPSMEGVTQQAIFFCDSNSDAIGNFLWINTNKLSGGGTPRVVIKGYVYNRDIQSRFEVFRATIDTGAENTISFEEPVGFKLSPGDILYFVADTDTNGTVVNLRFSLNEYKRDSEA